MDFIRIIVCILIAYIIFTLGRAYEVIKMTKEKPRSGKSYTVNVVERIGFKDR